jgi:hypothetical protein
MAIAKSNRSAPRFAGAADRRRSQAACHRSRAKKDVPRVSAKPPFAWLRDLAALRLRLRAIYGTAITAELALRQQAAEQDAEIADCMREGLCNPLLDEIGKLDAITRHLSSLGGTSMTDES